MSRRDLKDHLSSYYADHALAPETAKRLAALAQVDEPSTPITRSHEWSTRSVLALAACVAVAAVAGTTVMTSPPAADRPTEFPALVEQRREPLEEPTRTPTRDSDLSDARYVVVKFEVAGCPNTLATEASFAKLEAEYGNQCVLFTRIDITNDLKQQQAKLLARTLGIDCVYEDGMCQSGTLMLVDREKAALLAVAANPQQVPRWESELARAIP